MKSDTILLVGVLVLVVASLAYVGSYYYTGRITAYVNATISTLNSIKFSNTTLNWGSGSIAAGATSCLLTTNGTNLNCTGFNTISTDLQIINDGNVNVSLNISSDKTGTTLLGGAGPLFMYNATNNESYACIQRRSGMGLTGSCNTTNGGTIYNSSQSINGGGAVNYVSFGTAATMEVCQCFRPGDSNDAIDIEILLQIPSDAPPTGIKNAIVTVTADTID